MSLTYPEWKSSKALEFESSETDSWRDECAVMGVWNHDEAAHLCYLGLFAMQHRGQESAGIVALDGKSHRLHRGLGLVGDVFTDETLKMLPGRCGIGHVRYSTTGQNLITNAQPLSANLLMGPVAVAHNGNLVNDQELKKKLQEQGSIFQGTTDTEIFLHLLAMGKGKDFLTILKQSLDLVKGAFSLVVMTDDAIYAVRDPRGFRPLVLGIKKNDQGGDAYMVASETCAFDLIGAQLVREVEPGEILRIDADGLHSHKLQALHQPKRCVFEHVYFSRPDSVVFGHSVYEKRKAFGRQLARENPVDADLVVPVPDSGVPAALGYAAESGIEFDLGIIRNHYIGRTFIQPHQSIRNFGVKIKLNPQSHILMGKRVIIVDDSLVRGTTSQKIVRLVRQAGAKEVHVRISSPPTVSPCFYGVDTPQKAQLIAARLSIEEIRDFIEADSLAYLSLDGMLRAFPVHEQQHFCSACFDGKYPV